MRLYIWKHKNTANSMLNFYPLSRVKELDNGIYPIACHAFFKKKEAIKYLKDIGWEEDIIKSFELISVEVGK